MEEFKLEDLKCYQIEIAELSDDDQRSFEIWALGFTTDKWSHEFYIGDAMVAEISKDIVLDIKEI